MHFMLKVLVKNCNDFWVVTEAEPFALWSLCVLSVDPPCSVCWLAVGAEGEY
jgi:hypothetical protein